MGYDSTHLACRRVIAGSTRRDQNLAETGMEDDASGIAAGGGLPHAHEVGLGEVVVGGVELELADLGRLQGVRAQPVEIRPQVGIEPRIEQAGGGNEDVILSKGDGVGVGPFVFGGPPDRQAARVPIWRRTTIAVAAVPPGFCRKSRSMA